MNDKATAPIGPHGARLLGVDTGGTFTDFVLFDATGIRVHKTLSTPDAPERAIIDGLRYLGLDPQSAADSLLMVHGSTVATNAALEGKGARTVYVGNRGFADLLSIGRQTRRQLYALSPEHNPEPVPSPLCVEVGGRLSAQGELLDPLTPADIAQVRAVARQQQASAIAINLLFSFLRPDIESRLAAALADEFFVCYSAEVLGEYREYERGIATWLCAWLGPQVGRYLQRLRRALGEVPLAIMQSSGGTIDAASASRRAVNLLLSGPAGGLLGARFVAAQAACERLLTFDMGGTSTDVALIDKDIQLTSEGRIGPWPVAVPMVDMHTIGAGGGSIARVDHGGMLLLGPQSAGADPGPACYGRGGTEATLTDANLVLGRLHPDRFLGGAMVLDRAAAEAAVGRIARQLKLSLESTAAGIVRIANEHMAAALRLISVQRGHDIGDFTLCSFGGAGGLHVCALAEALELDTAMVPVHAGVLSALGLVIAPRQRQLSRSMLMAMGDATEDDVEAVISALRHDGEEALIGEGVPKPTINSLASVDLRYLGQSYTLNLPWQGKHHSTRAFHALHQTRYGHAMAIDVELVNVRVVVLAQLHQPQLPRLSTGGVRPQCLAGQPLEREQMPPGAEFAGPLLITETAASTWVAAGWQAYRDELGNLRLTRGRDGRQ